jgi:hypothetical protein
MDDNRLPFTASEMMILNKQYEETKWLKHIKDINRRQITDSRG